ncbi:MAG: cation-translocating P-type ATPase, partial [Planctomycetota bacterium]
MTDQGQDVLFEVVEGLHCASCVRRLETAMRAAPGVSHLDVDLVSRTARLRLDGSGLDVAGVTARLDTAGFSVRTTTTDAAPADDTLNVARQARLDAIIAATLALTCMVWSMTTHHGYSLWLQAILAITTLAWPGRHVLRRGAQAAWRRRGDMDVLVSLGAAAACLHGLIGLLLGWPHLHFESAAAIIAFTLIGRALEAKARAATGAAVAALLARQPATAAVIASDGSERRIAASALRVGDRVRIRPGEALPADGVVSEGVGEIDEALLTGEPLPVAKHVHATVIAGSVNRLGSFVITVTAAGATTSLAKTADAMRRAQAARPPIARIADQVAAVFVPIALALAVLTWVGWWLLAGPDGWRDGLIAAINVLVIACPCALGLATPAAIATAVGRAARLGILVRDGTAFESLAHCTVAALDKTGTVTRGMPELVAAQPATNCDRDTLLRLAAAVEAGSEHPIARAIVIAARGLTVPTSTDFSAVPGGGARAVVEGAEVLVGTRVWLTARGIAVPHDPVGPGSVAHVAAAGTWIGSLRCADALRPEAATDISRLRAYGFRVVMITGDRAEEARRVAAALAIGDVRADLTPEAKAGVIADCERVGDRVLAIGDGVNDAAMLARASVGAAVGGGADVAALAGGLVLDGRRPLGAAVDAIGLARATMRTIRWNLAGAAAYNIVAFPLAAGALYPL